MLYSYVMNAIDRKGLAQSKQTETQVPVIYYIFSSDLLNLFTLDLDER